ncbi:MAG: ABC-type Mn/Zn transport system [Lachnospiraceae bacterium]|jgi:zinc transport system permease protein|nr:ABC-type Mn/Zn transport system [Lachnospiraceae bacterium]
MMQELIINTQEMLSYSFIVRAMIVGALVSLCSALLGVNLVLKRYAVIGNGISDVAYGAISAAVAFGWAPIPITISISILASVLLMKLGNNSKLKSDSAIAILGSSSLAFGTAATSITTGLNTDVCNYMFGSILAMSKEDVYLSIAVSIVVILLYSILYHNLFMVTFDEDFARAGGIRVGLYNNLIAVLTAVTIVIGMRLMGTLLISSIIIFPALTSMRIFKNYRSVVIVSAGISIITFFIGIYLSYLYSISTGAMIVLTNLAAFLLAMAVEKMKGAKKYYAT